MKLDGRRESQNVEDRRGRRMGKTSLGIGTTIIVGLIIWALGGNPMQVLQGNLSETLSLGNQEATEYVPTPEEEALATFSRRILAGTEDVWSRLFAQYGRTYEPPRMIFFTNATQSACGAASSQTGPFYCSGDRSVYIDLSFFKELRDRFGAKGDFAYAYVIAHEVGHHVQHLLGTLEQAHQEMRGLDQKSANAVSVRLELQADYYAGVWAHHDNEMFASMEIGDIEEGIAAAEAIGDDRLQMNAQGYVVPDAFNHGTSAQRAAWLLKGYRLGTLEDGDTFSLPDPPVSKF